MTDHLPSNQKVSQDTIDVVCAGGGSQSERDAVWNYIVGLHRDLDDLQRELVDLKVAYDCATETNLAQAAKLRAGHEPAAECPHCDEYLTERDRAQDALQETHMALGGDGEWKGKLPPQPAPDSGDLHLDVPALARERMEEIETLKTLKGAALRAFINTAIGAAQPPDPDARRYQRLRILGCAPLGSPLLAQSLVMRFQSLDEFLDADITAHPSRGEASYSGSTKCDEA